MEKASEQSCKRLFGLWVVCVFLALRAVVNFERALRGTLLGAVLFGIVAVTCIVVAIALWRRSIKAWTAAIVLSLVSVVFPGLMFTCSPSDWESTVVVITISFLPSVAVVSYLFWRRKYFGLKGEYRPCFKTGLFTTTFGVLLGFGACSVAIMTVDDEPLAFPGLQLKPLKVDQEENGYVLFLQLQEEGLSKEISEAEGPWYKFPEPGTKRYVQWLPVARKMLAKNEKCLEKIMRILDRPHFVFPAQSFPFGPDIEWGSAARNLVRLLSLKSSVELADGRLEEAVRSAQGAIDLGLLYAGARGSLDDCLGGLGMVSIGLAKMRTVMASPTVEERFLENVLGKLEVEQKLREAFLDCVRNDYHRDKDMLRKLSDPEEMLMWMKAGLPPSMQQAADRQLDWQLWRSHFVNDDFLLIIKPNMSDNLLGMYYEELVRKVANSKAEAAIQTAKSNKRLVRKKGPEVGVIDWLRNPIGTVLCDLHKDALLNMLSSYFRVVANLRATKLCVAIRLYHLQNGALPGELKELVPDFMAEIPEDPFSKRPFGYARETEPPALFSVGPDGRKDTEGTAEGEGDDIVIELNFPMPTN